MKERPLLFSAPLVRALLDGRKTQTRRIVTTREPLQFIGGRGEEADPDKWGWFFDGPDHHGYMVLGRGHDERQDHGIISIPCPYGEPGDRLWCKETWRTGKSFDDKAPRKIAEMALEAGYTRAWGPVRYAADDADNRVPIGDFGGEWGKIRPSIFMPRWASRITLEITEVRVQRLQEISEDDARAEGVSSGRIPADEDGPERIGYVLGADDGKCTLYPTARDAFAAGWDSINGKPRPMPDDDDKPVLDDSDRPIMVASRSWSSNPWVWALTFRRLP